MLRASRVMTRSRGARLVLPILFVIALLVRLTSPGPVLYTQLRVGLDRRRLNTTIKNASIITILNRPAPKSDISHSGGA